ncbi:hypothetical protein D3C81_2173500 [compost metagenome]
MLPGIGSMKGVEPVAINRRSYSALLPSAAITRRLTRSISTTLRLSSKVMLWSWYQVRSLSSISSKVCSPASTGESKMRL